MIRFPRRILVFIASIVLLVFSVNIYTKKIYDRISSTGGGTDSQIPDIKALTDKEGDKQVLKVSELNEEQKILSFDMTGYDNSGKKKWDIQGKSADIVSDVVILRDLEANSYNKDRTVMLKAQSGEYNKKKNSIELEDNVVVTTSDGIRITADSFQWNSESDLISTDSYVEVKKDNLFASGYGASASTKEKDIKLNKDIVVKQDDVTITCKGPLDIDYEKDTASFYEKVKVIEPRGELSADRLDIFFDRKSRKIDKVVAERNVELKQGENVAKGQKIIYSIASGIATLTGNPEIVIYSKEELKNAFTGD